MNDNYRYFICSDHQHDISVFKFCIIWGVWLALFADALLFDHMLKTGYEDGVDTIQDLIDRDMSLGIRFKLNKNGNQSLNEL